MCVFQRNVSSLVCVHSPLQSRQFGHGYAAPSCRTWRQTFMDLKWGLHFLCSQAEHTVHSIHNSLDFNAHCLWHIAHAPAVSSLWEDDDVDGDGCCDVETVGVVSSHLVLFSPFPLASSTITCFLWENFLWTCWWTMRNPISFTHVFKY